VSVTRLKGISTNPAWVFGQSQLRWVTEGTPRPLERARWKGEQVTVTGSFDELAVADFRGKVPSVNAL